MNGFSEKPEKLGIKMYCSNTCKISYKNIKQTEQQEILTVYLIIIY